MLVPSPAACKALVTERPVALPLEESKMHGYLKDHSGVFAPDQVRTLVAAFDKAWASVQASGVIFDTDVEIESVRAILAKHIIEAAEQGERDQRRLRDGALVALARSNLRSAARQTFR
jgi:hypothetical protein